MYSIKGGNMIKKIPFAILLILLIGCTDVTPELVEEVIIEPAFFHELNLIEVQYNQIPLTHLTKNYYVTENDIYRLTYTRNVLNFVKVLSTQELLSESISHIITINESYYILQAGNVYYSSRGSFEPVKYDSSIKNDEQILAISQFDEVVIINSNLGRTFYIGEFEGLNTSSKEPSGNTYAIDVSENFNLEMGEYFIKGTRNNGDNFALTNLGNVYIWGQNSFGRHGNGSTNEVNNPFKSENFTIFERGEKIVDFEVNFMAIIYRTNFMNYFAVGGLNNILDTTIFTVSLFPMLFLNPYNLNFNKSINDYFETGNRGMENQRKFANLKNGNAIYWGKSLHNSEDLISANDSEVLFEFLTSEDRVTGMIYVDDLLLVNSKTKIHYLDFNNIGPELSYNNLDLIVTEEIMLDPKKSVLDDTYTSNKLFEEYEGYIISSDPLFNQRLTTNDDLTQFKTIYITKLND